MKIRKQISLSFYTIILALVSCISKDDNLQIVIYSTDNIEINNVELKKQQVEHLSDFLMSLNPSQKEVYSKPNYTITIRQADSTLLLSVFKAEKFIYLGDYLETWNDRMQGDKTKGFKLEREFLTFLENYK